MKGGEKVETGNIITSVADLNLSAIKVKRELTQEKNKAFTKILKSAEKETEKLKNLDKDSEIINEKDQNIQVETEVTEDSISGNEDSELINLLLTLINYSSATKQSELLSSIEQGDLKQIENIFSELVSNSFLGSSIKDNSINSDALSSNNVYLENISIDTEVNNVVSKLKEAVIMGFQGQSEKLNNDNSQIIEKTLLQKINESFFVKNNNEGDIKETSIIVPKVKVRQQEEFTEIKQAIDYSLNNKDNATKEDAILSYSDKTSQQMINNPSYKEEKILLDLLGDGSRKEKDNFSDKITNMLNRFEAVKAEKTLTLENKIIINKNSLNTDVIKAVKYMDLNNIKELTVKIIPKELGEIVIRLTMDNGVLKANLTAANKDTFELLNSQLPIINNELSKQNMSIQSFSLSLYNGDNFLFNSNGNSEDSSRQQGRKGTKITASGEEEVVEEYSLEQSNVNILA